MSLIPNFIHRRIAHRPNLVKIVDNVGWLFIDKVLRMGMGVLVGVWVARYLGPQQFGLFSYAVAFIGLFSWVAGLGLHNIVVRDIILNPNCKEETLGTAAVLQLAGGVLAYGLTLAAIFLLRPDDTLAKWLVAILGCTTLFRASEVAMYWFESQVQSKYTVWIQNSGFLIFTAVKVTLILTNAPLLAFAWSAMAEAALVALLFLVVLDIRGQRLSMLKVSLAKAKELLATSWPLLLTVIAMTLYMKIDLIMLGQMKGDESVGIYNSATRLSEVWYFIPMVITASLFPSILDARKKNEAIYYQRLQRLYDLMVWLSVGLSIPMTFLATPIVTFLYGPEYAEAAAVLVIHIWASVFVFLGVASAQWFMAENRQILIFQRALLGAITNVLFNYIFIPEFGVVGAAYGTVLAQASASLIFDLAQKETHQMFTMKIRAFNPLRLKAFISGK